MAVPIPAAGPALVGSGGDALAGLGQPLPIVRRQRRLGPPLIGRRHQQQDAATPVRHLVGNGEGDQHQGPALQQLGVRGRPQAAARASGAVSVTRAPPAPGRPRAGAAGLRRSSPSPMSTISLRRGPGGQGSPSRSDSRSPARSRKARRGSSASCTNPLARTSADPSRPHSASSGSATSGASSEKASTSSWPCRCGRAPSLSPREQPGLEPVEEPGDQGGGPLPVRRESWRSPPPG